jgi:uncharacterized protein (DUF302 family)
MKKASIFILVMFIVQLSQAASAYKTDEELYFKKTLIGSFIDVTERVKNSLKDQGFSVITEIDMDRKLNEKLNTEVKPYKILGACNPGYAYKTLQIDDNIGVFLPCKVIIKQLEKDKVEVVSVNPSMMMKMLQNDELSKVADDVSSKLKAVIDNL